MGDFSKFNKIIDTKKLKEDVKSASEKSKEFAEVPVGKYEVKIEKMELTESKSGKPMFSCWFKIIEGEQKNHLIFMNQIITEGFQIHIVNEMLRSFDTGLDIMFDDFDQYGELILDVYERIEEEKLEFALEYGKKNDFPTFKIVDVFSQE